MPHRRTLPLLLAALLAACASAPDDAPPLEELLIIDARVPGHDGPVRVLVRGDAIAAVGSEVVAPSARTLDARGGLVLPGFHDAHAHVLMGGLEAGKVDLRGLATEAECAEAVRRWAEAHPDAPWIGGGGWSYDIVPRGRFPTRQALDRVVPDRPVLLEAYDGHSAWANTRALEVAGIDSATPDPADGRIVREEDGATPQGTLLEEAMSLAYEAEPEVDHAAERAALLRALDEFLRLGITSVQTMCGSLDEVALYEELDREGRLPIHVTVAVPLGTDLAAVTALRERLRGPRLRFGFLKGFLDGVIESRTAFLLEPYAGSTERGAPHYAKDELLALVREAHAAGVPVALHAIGDAAVRLALDAYQAAARARPDLRVRHRIEHLEVVHDDDLPRFRALDVVASMQPYHAVPSDAPSPDEAWSANLGPERLARSFPWRALVDAGAPLAFGSDWSVMTQDPLRGLAVAVTRRNERGLPREGWQAHQALAVDEALRAYSVGAAYAVGQEGEVGTLAPGQRADLVVLSPDARLDDPSTLWSARVRAVIVAGRVAVDASAPVAPR